jgi:hypothetical protein
LKLYCTAVSREQAAMVEIGKFPVAPVRARSTASVVAQKSRVPVLLKTMGAAPTTKVLLVPPDPAMPVASRL